MSDFTKMTIEERKAALHAASQAIGAAAGILRPHVPLFEQFKREQADMENFGHIFDPTLYRDQGRRDTAVIMEPLYEAAQRLVDTFDVQINAVIEQAGKRAVGQEFDHGN